jgi:hypothetical protein
MFNLIVKDPCGLIRLSGTLLDRGPEFYIQVVLELDALAGFHAYYGILRCFCANLLKLSEFPSQVKPVFPGQTQESHREKPRAAQNIKERPAQKAPGPLGSTGDKLLGLAMACSL